MSKKYKDKILLFDIDGVIVPEGELYFRDRLIEKYGIEPEKTNPFFYFNLYRCLVGKCDIYEDLPKYFDEWGWEGDVDDLLDFWFREEDDVDEDLLEKIQILRKSGYRCIIASNQEKNRAHYLLEEVGLQDHFDGSFFSYQMGSLKDNATFFIRLSEALDVPYERLVFWDNEKDNINMARSLGITAFLYTGIESFDESMELFGLSKKGKEEEEVVRNIKLLSSQVFSKVPSSVERYAGAGVNLVYEVKIPEEETTVFELNPQRERKNLFRQSADVSKRALEKGIPTHEVIAVGGGFIPYAWMIYKKIEGVPAHEWDGNKIHIWEQIGEIAARINKISMPGYGSVKFWIEDKKDAYSESWKEELDNKVAQFEELGILESGRFFTEKEIGEVYEEFQNIRQWKFKPSLIHGNLSLDNVIIKKDGTISGIIDWDEAMGGRVPQHELATAFSWYMTEEDQDAFMKGYELSTSQWHSIKRDVMGIQLLMYLSHLMWHSHHGEDLSTKDMIGRIRRTLKFLSS